MIDEEFGEPQDREAATKSALASRVLVSAEETSTGRLADLAGLNVEEQIELPGGKHVALKLAGDDLLDEDIEL